MVTIRSSSSEVSSPALFSQSAPQHFLYFSVLHASRLRYQGVPLVQVDIGLLANQVRVSATDTLYLGQGVHDLLLSVDIGVQKTQDLTQHISPPVSVRGSFDVAFAILRKAVKWPPKRDVGKINV